MVLLCITLKERNIKQFVQNWHLQKPQVFDRMVIIFYGIRNFCFICYAVGLLQGLYSHKLYFNASKLYQNIEVKIVCYIYNVFKFRGTLKFYISNLKMLYIYIWSP